MPRRKSVRNSTLINESNKKFDSIQAMIEGLEDTFNSKLKRIFDGDNLNKEKSGMKKTPSKIYSKLFSKFTMMGETDEGFSIKGFEKMKEFNIYYPNNNTNNVLRNYRRKNLKKGPISFQTNSKRFKNTKDNYQTGVS